MSGVFVATRWGANQTCDEIYRNEHEYVLKWKEDGEVITAEFIPVKRVIYYKHVNDGDET